MGNFDFLKDDFKNLYDIAYEMEYELLNFRPKSSVCFGSRFFEELLREIYRINPELGKSTFMNPYAMINNLYEKGGISKEIKNKFDEVRRLRNRIIHNDPTTGMALEFNEANFRLAIWFYSRIEPNTNQDVNYCRMYFINFCCSFRKWNHWLDWTCYSTYGSYDCWPK